MGRVKKQLGIVILGLKEKEVKLHWQGYRARYILKDKIQKKIYADRVISTYCREEKSKRC